MSYRLFFKTDNSFERSEEGLKTNVSFSTEFCYFLLCRKNVTENGTKINQIEELIDFDFSAFYEIEFDMDCEITLKSIIENSDNDEEKNKCFAEIRNEKIRFEEMKGNLVHVLKVVTELKNRLLKVKALYQHLKPTDFNSFSNDNYFLPQSKVNIFKDLGLLIQFLKTAEKSQAKTIWYECN